MLTISLLGLILYIKRIFIVKGEIFYSRRDIRIVPPDKEWLTHELIFPKRLILLIDFNSLHDMTPFSSFR